LYSIIDEILDEFEIDFPCRKHATLLGFYVVTLKFCYNCYIHSGLRKANQSRGMP